MSVECRGDDPYALDRTVGSFLLDDPALIEAVVCAASCLFHANA